MPGVPLDTENLSNIADRLDAEHQSLNTASDGPRDLDGLGDNLEALEIDDEACTMQPVGDTTARSLTLYLTCTDTSTKPSQISQGSSRIGTSPCVSKT